MTDEQIVDEDAQTSLPPGRVTRLSDETVAYFRSAFERFGRGEQIVFELGLQALPQPPASDAPINPVTGQPDPFWSPQLMLYVEIHGIVPMTRIFNAWPLLPHAWTQEKADAVAQQVLPQLLASRSNQLKEMTKQAQQAMAEGNGHGGSPSGLIVPGQ